MGDVFIAYSHNEFDKKWAEKIEKRLDAAKIDFVIDKYFLGPGDKLREKITKAIRDTDNFLALLSANSIDSQWVNDEIAMAFEKRAIEAIDSKLKELSSSKIIFCILDQSAENWIENYHSNYKQEAVLVYLHTKETDLDKLENTLLSRKKLGNFIKELGVWSEKENSNGKVFVTNYDPKFYRPPSILSYTPINPDNCENLRFVKVTIKVDPNLIEWKAGILLRKYNCDLNTECLRFYISGKENVNYLERPYADDRYMGCYTLSLTKVNLDINDRKRTRIGIFPQYTLFLEIDGENITCKVLNDDGNELGKKFFITKRKSIENDSKVIFPYFEIRDIRQVCLCAWTRDSEKQFEIEFSDVRVSGLDYPA